MLVGLGLSEIGEDETRRKGAKELRSFPWCRVDWVVVLHPFLWACVPSDGHMTSESVWCPWDPTH